MKLVGIFLLLCASSLFSSAPAKAAAEQPANSQPAAAAGNASNKFKYEVSTASSADADIKTIQMTNLTSGAWVKKVVTFKKSKSDASKNRVEDTSMYKDFEGSDKDVQSLWTKLQLREEVCNAAKVLTLINGFKQSAICNSRVTIGDEVIPLLTFIQSISRGTASDSGELTSTKMYILTSLILQHEFRHE